VIAGKLLRIFIDEDDRVDGGPLHLAVVEALRSAGFNGATALKGIEGFGRSRRVRSARTADLAISLPVLIEVIEGEGKIDAFLPTLEAMMTGGLVTLETIQLIHVTDANA
jgi:PII-like signaling protein